MSSDPSTHRFGPPGLRVTGNLQAVEALHSGDCLRAVRHSVEDGRSDLAIAAPSLEEMESHGVGQGGFRSEIGRVGLPFHTESCWG